jgi:hypothetical protein
MSAGFALTTLIAAIDPNFPIGLTQYGPFGETRLPNPLRKILIRFGFRGPNKKLKIPYSGLNLSARRRDQRVSADG